MGICPPLRGLNTWAPAFKLPPGYDGEPIVESPRDAEMALQQNGHLETDLSLRTYYEGKVNPNPNPNPI